eukprot:jgi/Tetstr1/443086/TSEL_031142.t1
MAAVSARITSSAVPRPATGGPRACRPRAPGARHCCQGVSLGSRHSLVPSFGALKCADEVRARHRQQARKQTQKRATTSGLPIPVIGFIFTPFTVALLYFAAAVRFWWNYQRTVYSSALVTRVTLTALWPVLLIISSTYRTNFSKAWKGN